MRPSVTVARSMDRDIIAVDTARLVQASRRLAIRSGAAGSSSRLMAGQRKAKLLQVLQCHWAPGVKEDNTVCTRDVASLCAWLVGVEGLGRAALAAGLFCTAADIIATGWS